MATALAALVPRAARALEAASPGEELGLRHGPGLRVPAPGAPAEVTFPQEEARRLCGQSRPKLWAETAPFAQAEAGT